MSHMFLELLIWSLIAFAIGCLIGCLARKMFGAGDVAVPAIAAATTATAAVAARAAMPAAKAPELPAAPAYVPPKAVVSAPEPLAPIPAMPRAAPVAPVAAAAPAAALRMSRPRGLTAARGGKADNLLRISGVGPKNETILHNLGVYHFDQIADWKQEEVDWVDDHIKFNGRITREKWIHQARLLADGKEAEFTRLYGTGGETDGGSVKPAAVPMAVAAPVVKVEPAPVKAEPVKAVPAPVAKPAVSKPAAIGKVERPKGIAKARGGKADNLQRISGVGPKNEKVLHSLGFFHFDQIAEWTGEQVAWVDEHLKFGGRIKREEWKRQARLLADGKEDEFTRLFGTGGLRGKGGTTQSGSRTRKR